MTGACNARRNATTDSHLHFVQLDGCREGVRQYTNRSGDTSLIFNDGVFNLKTRIPGFRGRGNSHDGSTGGSKLTRLGKILAVTKRDQLAAHPMRPARDAKPHRIIPGHGSAIDDDARETLLDVAARCRRGSSPTRPPADPTRRKSGSFVGASQPVSTACVLL